ncbi:Os02g0568700 [Oryza sativa Japonica Group]|uniref:Os02g0568700 protein n=1 Tax=Oryza sativa subsp. japonica TaxID=39947 RepID=A0A0N7KFI7_ORYSJ|nr:Os02g0568700 [Oryza sativa Japonica Group]
MVYLNDGEVREKTDRINTVRETLRLSMSEVSKTYSKLFLVDTLEKVGISRHFSREITRILDMAYKLWLQKDEEMIMDMETCAMAFRILRMHGYDVSSDVLAHFSEESRFPDSVVQGSLNDTKAILELYKASKVECALQLPFYSSVLEPLEHKRNIEHFSTNGIQMRKSAFLPHHIAEDIIALAVAEFHSAQSLYRQELQYVDSCMQLVVGKRWVKEVRLDQLKFLRILPLDVFFFLASSVLPRELSDARIAWIQNCLLTTAVDDLFDVAGSSEELQNLIALFEKWDAHNEIGFCSEDVETVFYAVYNTSNKIGERAAEVQNRSVISHIAQLWLDTARAMMKEAEWSREGHVPSMEEYMPVAEVSFALGPIVPTSLYLMGPELLPEEVVRGPEYGGLMRLTNVCCRLLNDMASYGRESGDGKIANSVLLLHLHSASSVDMAKEEIRRTVEASKRELLRLVITAAGGGGVPRPCKDLFWNMCKVANLTYLQANGYCSLEEMLGAASAVEVHEPLNV